MVFTSGLGADLGTGCNCGELDSRHGCLDVPADAPRPGLWAQDKWHYLNNAVRRVPPTDFPGTASAGDWSTAEENRQETGHGAHAGTRIAAGGAQQPALGSQTKTNYPTLLPPPEPLFFPRGVVCSCLCCASH